METLNHLLEGLKFSILWKEREEVTLKKFKLLCLKCPKLIQQYDVLTWMVNLLLDCDDENLTESLLYFESKCRSLMEQETPKGTVDLFEVYPPEQKSLYCDLGYVKLVDMQPRIVPVGRTADVAIARNARVSYNVEEMKSVEQDAKLIEYLVKNHHTSPLESVVFQFEMQIPIFVERQLIRHRTARVNEQSMRYTKAEDIFYFPDMRMQSQRNKQCSSEEKVSEELNAIWDNVKDLNKQLYESYEKLLEAGAAREVARCCLPVSLVTKLMFQMDLNNLMKFFKLRMAPDAQKEIRDLANAMFEIVQPYIPATINATK